MLLAAQAATDATIEGDTELFEMFAQYFGLAHADGRQDIVVVCTE